MYKLAFCILIPFALSSAKVTKNSFVSFPDSKDSASKINKNNTIWVLSLSNDDLEFQRLSIANRDEERVFRRIIAPSIKSYELQNSRRVKKDDPITPISEEQQEIKNEFKEVSYLKDVKQEISIILNKFFLTHLNDPGAYFTEEFKEPSLKLFFTGPYSSLVVTSRYERYQFFINPPSPLPSWFYEHHVLQYEKEYVEIPIDVQHDFLERLLQLLKIFLSYPL